MTPATAKKVLSWEELCALPYFIDLDRKDGDLACDLEWAPGCCAVIEGCAVLLCRPDKDFVHLGLPSFVVAEVRKWHDGGTLYIVYPPPKYPVTEDDERWESYITEECMREVWGEAASWMTPHDPASMDWPDTDHAIRYLIRKDGTASEPEVHEVVKAGLWNRKAVGPMSGHTYALPTSTVVTKKKWLANNKGGRLANKKFLDQLEVFLSDFNDTILQYTSGASAHILLPTSDTKATSCINFESSGVVLSYSQLGGWKKLTAGTRIHNTTTPQEALTLIQEAVICSFHIPGPE